MPGETDSLPRLKYLNNWSLRDRVNLLGEDGVDTGIANLNALVSNKLSGNLNVYRMFDKNKDM